MLDIRERLQTVLQAVGGSLLLAAGLLYASPVSAAAANSGSSITISATIAPVRSILVDKHGTIKQIVSNTSDDVTPTVYLNNFNSTPISLSLPVNTSYRYLIIQTAVKCCGVIYPAPVSARQKPQTTAERHFSYRSNGLSILFLKHS